jgi:EAL domain-containing protein (putative c-di-GMP-specific phosphodiesterase class I)/GGDEF domain-containing protein
MYENRLIGVMMSEHIIAYSDWLLVVERIVHYCLTLAIYSLYAYFIYCLVGQHNLYSAKWKVAFWTPTVVVDLLILTSPWTHLIFYVEDGVSHNGRLFLLLVIIRVAYAIEATVYALMKRRLLIRIFGQSIIILAVFAVLQGIEYAVLQDETLYYSTLIVNVIIFMLTITMVEFYNDGVTGLFNRKAFKQYASKEIHKSGHKAVYLIKIKNFDYFKNNYPDAMVADLLKQLADYIKQYSLLSSIYYLGDGKFAVITHKTDKFDEKEFFDKIRRNFCNAVSFNGASFQLGLLVVVMNLENERLDKSNFARYFSACDEIRGKGNELLEIVYGDTLGFDELQKYRIIEDAIDRALVENEFEMYYQPIVDTRTGKVISAEALIRLKDRELGFVSPEDFIPISENNGKILEISEFVVDSVFKFVKEHDITAMGMEFIEMNLSVMQCMDKTLIDKLKFYIDKYDIDPTHINLEITETATNFDENRLKEQLVNIKKLGFTFSLDDYGTGYSNLVRVLEYPVDIIKLDKSIVWSAFSDNDSFVTLKNIVSMFHDVRRKLVAEGVESEEQMQALKELGCDYIQGYFYSKPVPKNDFWEYVKKVNSI